MDIRRLKQEEREQAIDLAWNVYCTHEAEIAGEDSKEAFHRVVHSEEYLDALDFWGSFEGERLTGILATRNAGSHIALFLWMENFSVREQERVFGRQL